MHATKHYYREFFRKERAKISWVQNQEFSEAIAMQLLSLLARHPVRTIHSFIGDRQRHEVDTVHIHRYIQAWYPQIVWTAPRVLPGTRQMEQYVWQEGTQLLPNRWGIQEPVPAFSQKIEPHQIDLVLVPLLAYDTSGNRVGYGGGYYDQFLKECREDSLKIGLSFFPPVEKIEDIHAQDVRLDGCVTPTTMYPRKTDPGRY